ncbi:MAG: ABC transporter ATP-binding protein [Actinomycetota bacterium]|nr:ABC transporter ATP-binding protein [Actinomycetota bacterium]
MSLQADVRVRRGDGFLLDASLRVPGGRTVALLGPNGAGKSTFVSALAGLEPLQEGRIELDGATLEDSRTGTRVPAQARPVGVVFQDLLLFPHLSALENVAFPLRARGVQRAEARRSAQALLDRLGVGHRSRARPGELSGGEAQRVALARALVHQPRLMLLDEPLSSLDVRARAEIRTLVRTTLAGFDGVRVLVTHDPVEAMTLADELVLLEDGRVTQTGTPEEIRAAPRTPYAAELVGLNLFAGRLVRLEDGAGRIETADGDIVVAWPPDAEEAGEAGEAGADGVLALLRPSDVSLYRSRPEGSARNVMHGKVTSVSIEADRARIRVASAPPLVAEVTPGSVTRLGLTEGVDVWASFKAVEVTVLLP